jgi:hypothetical protein
MMMMIIIIIMMVMMVTMIKIEITIMIPWNVSECLYLHTLTNEFLWCFFCLRKGVTWIPMTHIVPGSLRHGWSKARHVEPKKAWGMSRQMGMLPAKPDSCNQKTFCFTKSRNPELMVKMCDCQTETWHVCNVALTSNWLLKTNPNWSFFGGRIITWFCPVCCIILISLLWHMGLSSVSLQKNATLRVYRYTPLLDKNKYHRIEMSHYIQWISIPVLFSG